MLLCGLQLWGIMMKPQLKEHNVYPNEYCPINPEAKTELPGSETSFAINLTAGIIALSVLGIFKAWGGSYSPMSILLVLMVVLSGSIWGLEFLFHSKNSLYADIKVQRQCSWERLKYKFLALGVVWVSMAFLYWLLPIYRDGLFDAYFAVFVDGWWFWLSIAIAYFVLEDKVAKCEYGPYWQLGRWLCGHKNDADKKVIIELFRGWGVKFFFLALMFSYFIQRIDWFMRADISKLFGFPYDVFLFLNEFIFLIDILFAATGYMMTLRLFNTQIRSSEPTLFGWFVAVLCYWPFNNLWQYYLEYPGQLSWVKVFENTGIWFVLWMSAILIFELIFSLSTVALGLRFSNLTYRGLVTSGPYRFTKHPAYVCKNIAWWMMSMPFMLFASDWQFALRSCLTLLLVNILYYCRAKTEENHLSHYPEYVEYALKMNEKSIFAPVAKILPFLKYKAPQK